MKQRYSLFRFSKFAAAGLLLALCGQAPAAQAQANNALLFNGSTKYVQTNSVTLNTSNLSMEAWVKVTAFKTASPLISSVIGIEDGNAAAMLRFGDVGIPASKMQFILTVGTVQYKVLSATSFSTNTWYHVAGTFDGSTMRLYVNGVLDASTPAVGTAAGTGIFAIGRNYEAVRTLNGSVDEVRVWTRTLSAAELVTNACQVSPTATGLEGYWRLDEGTGTTTADLTGHGHTGTLTGMVASDWTTVVPTQCARVTAVAGAVNPANGLQVVPNENPVTGASTEVEIRGVAGKPVLLQVLNSVGQVVVSKALTASSMSEKVSLNLPAAAGLYVLRANAPGGAATAKLLKY